MDRGRAMTYALSSDKIGRAKSHLTGGYNPSGGRRYFPHRNNRMVAASDGPLQWRD